MLRNKFWRMAALVALGTSAGVFAFEANRHPDSVAAAMTGLISNPLVQVTRLACCRAQDHATKPTPCNEPNSEVPTHGTAAEETSEPTPVTNNYYPTRKTEIITLYNVEPAEAVTALQTYLTNAYPEGLPGVVIVAEPITHKLIVSVANEDCDEIMPMIDKLIKAIDVQPAQVQIEVLIAEIDCSKGKEGLGIFGDGEKVRTLPNDQFAALIGDLQKQGRLEVVSAPTIHTSDNQSARILVGQNFPYISGSVDTSSTEGTPTVTNTVAYRDIGTQVQVTPTVAPDNTVTMRIIPEICTAVPTNVKVSEGVFATAFDVQTLETTVILKEGETAVLGGMTQTRDVGTTWFGFPQKQKNDVLVFVTAHVTRQQQ